MKHKEADDHYFFEKIFDLFKDNCELDLVIEKRSNKIIGAHIY